MDAAIQAALPTRPHPNPRVGAVVLSRGGAAVGAGVHHGPGTPHAEVVALEAARGAAADGTLVVTLEPCNHHGRTPPCTEAIRRAGIRRVVVGALDPDERVAGSGLDHLRRAGIDVVHDVASDAVRALDPGYFHHRSTGRARVTVKLAATLDGQAAARDGTSQWITGDAARADVHRLRASADAVAVGAETARRDDPQLTVRTQGFAGPQPRPVVIAGRLPIPSDLRVFERAVLVYAVSPFGWPSDAEVVEVPGVDGRADLAAIAQDLPTRSILDVFVEGGPTLAAGLARAGLVDEYVLYFGARLGLGSGRPMFGGAFDTLTDARPVAIDSVTRLGSDLRVTCHPVAAGGTE